MECGYGVRLDAYHDGELSPSAARELELHLESCEHCRYELADLRAIRGAFTSLPDEALSAIGMRCAHGAADALRGDHNPSLLLTAGLFAGLAASIMIVAAAWLATGSPPQEQYPAVAAVPRAPEWERVAITLEADRFIDVLPGEDSRQMLAAASTRDERVADWVLRSLTR